MGRLLSHGHVPGDMLTCSGGFWQGVGECLGEGWGVVRGGKCSHNTIQTESIASTPEQEVRKAIAQMYEEGECVSVICVKEELGETQRGRRPDGSTRLSRQLPTAWVAELPLWPKSASWVPSRVGTRRGHQMGRPYQEGTVERGFLKMFSLFGDPRRRVLWFYLELGQLLVRLSCRTERRGAFLQKVWF